MLIYVLASFAATFLYACGSHFDKFLLSKGSNKDNNICSMLIFSSLLSGLFFIPVTLILSGFHIELDLVAISASIGAAIVYILACFLYFNALEKNDASIIITMFQLTPVFTYLLSAACFDEVFTPRQLIGSAIVIFSAVGISFGVKSRKKQGRYQAFVLVMCSSILYSLYYFLMDVAIRHVEYHSCVFFYQIGLILIGLLIILNKENRDRFKRLIKRRGKSFFAINMSNELFCSIATFLVNFANTVLPITMINVIDGFQGCFSFLIAFIGTKFLPKFFKENLSKKVVIRKISFMTISVIGLVLVLL